MVEQGYEPAVQFATEEEARTAVEMLLLRGLGATYEPADAPAAAGLPIGFYVVVAEGEAPRARQILEVPEPEPEPGDPQARKKVPQWVYVVLVFGVAMIVVPLIAFYVSFKLAGG